MSLSLQNKEKIMELGPDLITVKQLQKRWGKKDAEAIRHLVRRYNHILQPMRIGKTLYFYTENIKKFEDSMRVKK